MYFKDCFYEIQSKYKMGYRLYDELLQSEFDLFSYGPIMANVFLYSES